MKLKIKVFSFIMTVVVLLNALPIGAAAAGQNSFGWYGDYFVFFSPDHCEVAGYRGNETSISIPSELDGRTVTVISGGTYADYSSLTSINIPDSVTKIKEEAFRNCEKLTSVNIPSGVTAIGDYTFKNCKGLTSINIPNGVTAIGNYAFYNCTALTSINIPNSVTEIGKGAFYCCSNLTSVNMPNSATVLGLGAFCDCTALTSVNIPNGVTEIGYRTFDGCSSLTSINIPNGVTEIGEQAFYDCSSLTSINIPDSVTEIGKRAFSGCQGLTSINIPNGVTAIGDTAFYDCTALTSVNIPDSVTEIGGGAFYGCQGLTSINIPNSVTGIGDSAFYGCISLTSVNIPDSVTEIGKSVFSGCQGLTSVNIPNGVTAIGVLAFSGCISLMSINIPDSVTEIGNGIFAGCQGLTSINIPNAVTVIGDSAFSGCISLTSISIPDRVTVIGDSAFSGCISLMSINIPDSVTEIGDSAFNGCHVMPSINIPNGVTEIGDGAFGYCYELTSVCVPSGVTSIGNYAFDGCDSLNDVYYGGSEEEWNAIDIGVSNSPLLNATIHFDSIDVPIISELYLVSSTPTNGEKCRSSDLSLTFNGSIDINNELNSGEYIKIVDCSSERVIKYFDSYNFLSVGGYINGNTLTIPNFLDNVTAKEYCLVISPGFIFAKGNSSVKFEGIDYGEFVFFENSFIPEIDGNGFCHSRTNPSDGFYKISGYSLPENVFENLTKNCNSKKKNELKKYINETEWGGSCYGIAATMGLVFSGYISIGDITADKVASTYYNMPLPYKDKNKMLQHSINYYQLSQKINSNAGIYYGSSLMNAFPKLIEILDRGEIALFCYGYTRLGTSSGHAILAIDYWVNPDGSYTFKLYDENKYPDYLSDSSKKYRYIELSADMKSFELPMGFFMLTEEKGSCDYLKVSSFDDVYYGKPYSDEETRKNERAVDFSNEIVFSANNDFIIEDSDGKTLEYVDGIFSGDMVIYDYNTATVDNGYQWILSVADAPSYTVTNLSGGMDIDFIMQEGFISVGGSNIDEIEINSGDEVILKGDGGYDFTAYISTDEYVSENETNLISISANATDDTIISLDSSKQSVTAVSDAPLTNINSKSLIKSYTVPLTDLSHDDENTITVTTIPETGVPFKDVSESSWYYDSVLYAYRRSLMNGMSDTTFEPDGTTTRAQLVTILWRLEDSPMPETVPAFTDLDQSWYRDAVAWAAQSGIVKGITAEKFAPDAKITRQDMATMLYRYAGECGFDLTERADITSFPDAGDVSSYAADAVSWANAVGLINGNRKKDGKVYIDPKSNATRAQVAAILMRFCENVAE